MSRSYKKQLYCGIAATSDKKGKQKANRAFRRKEKTSIATFKLKNLPIHLNEVSDTWSFPKDGKMYFGNLKFKDEKWFIKLKRK